MQKPLKILACLSMVWITVASATSPCKRDECNDETSASFLAPLDVFVVKCSSLNPEMRERYSAVTAHLLQDTDADFLRKLRASKAYARVLAKTESFANSLSSEELVKGCEEFSKAN